MKRGSTGTPMRVGSRAELRPPKPLSDATLLHRAARDAGLEQRQPRIHTARPGQTFEPCPGCEGVIRVGDQYVNRKVTTTWRAWHTWCWAEHHPT